VSHDIQVYTRTDADIRVSLLCAAVFCSWSLSTTFCRRQQTVYSSNTYIYSWATINLGLWAGVLERRSSEAPRPWSDPWVIQSTARVCSVCWWLIHHPYPWSRSVRWCLAAELINLLIAARAIAIVPVKRCVSKFHKLNRTRLHKKILQLSSRSKILKMRWGFPTKNC